ncbi:MAG: hypothetical protein MUE44_32745 [Oscillatoriaceae cyanobacterium Prado104]|jgi:hypothetical protein|nr:hypothetical protein [Oscillatoriaceae cyanobacterium Prado104]
MSGLFVLTFMFSMPALCLGVVNPKWVGLPNRKRAIALYGGLMAVSFVSIGFAAPKPPQSVSAELQAAIER